MKALIILIMAIVFVASCHRNTFDIFHETERADSIYHGNDAVLAQKALESYISRAEANEGVSRKVKSINFDMALAWACLQLSSIYEINGDHVNSEILINKAIAYFDRDPIFASNPNYYKNKRTALIDLFNKCENSEKPQWKLQKETN